MALDGCPQLLAPEVHQSRPERDVWGRRPLRLEGGEALDRPNNADPRSFQQKLTREHRAVQLA
jgi:hypothetical protein